MVNLDERVRSHKKVLSSKLVFGKRMFIFSKEYATEADRETGKQGMLISINGNNVFIPCGEPVEITYSQWALLKDIGRIGRVVTVPQDEKPKEK